jgi:pimeloyl-ACP methyl ester carboxylesterase
MTEPVVTITQVDGLRTAAVVIGEGLPVVMLHGWGAHLRLLWPLAERLAPLGYRLYVPDLPGFGQSAPPSEAWSVHDYARWVLAYLDHHSLDKVYLFGHSFGGRLSLVLGADHPERIVKIALADSAGVRPKAAPRGPLRLKTYKGIQRGLRAVGLGAQADALRDWYTERYGSPNYKAAQGVMRATFVKVVNEDLLPVAARVQPSTLLLWGERDEDTPLWQGQLLAQTIPDAGLVTFPNAGHYSYLDHLAETVRVVDYFFKN